MDEWYSVVDTGFIKNYVSRLVYDSHRHKRVRKCQQMCTELSKAASLKTLTDSEWALSLCQLFGVSYKNVGTGHGECRFPVPPWSQKRGFVCYHEQSQIKFTHYHLSPVYCLLHCIQNYKNGCIDFGVTKINNTHVACTFDHPPV